MEIKKVLLTLVIVVFCSFCTFAQDTKALPIQKYGPFYAEVINSLDPTNPMYLAINAGMRGHGPHYFWMDEMKAKGIKHASFKVAFVWVSGKFSMIKAVRSTYLRNYFVFSDPFNDPKMTRSDLELQLQGEAESRAIDEARWFLIDRPRRSEPICGTLYEEIFDDERLPIVSTSSIELLPTCDGQKKDE